jgi:polygalacturonase
LSDLTVKNFGTKGDGITDDTAAIQKAINYIYSKGGGTVVIPDGTYLINPDTKISMKSNMKLSLSPNAVLKAKATSSGSYQIIFMWNISNVEIVGGKIIGDRANHIGASTTNWGEGIYVVGCNNVHIADVTVSNCWGDGITPVECAHLHGAENLTLTEVIHSPRPGRLWYGSPPILDQWLGYLK